MRAKPLLSVTLLALAGTGLLTGCNDRINPDGSVKQTPVATAQNGATGEFTKTRNSDQADAPTAVYPDVDWAETPRKLGGPEGDLIQYYYHPSAHYLIKTSPLRTTALLLRPEDRNVRVFGGDTQRWDIQLAEAGESVTVIIKPKAWKLRTNLKITTTEGLLSFELRTSKSPYEAVEMQTWKMPPKAPSKQGES